MNGRTGRRRAMLSVALALIITLVAGQAAMGALEFDETQVTDRTGRQGYPAIWGDTIVYEDYDTADGAPDIVMYDLVTGEETTLCSQPERQYDPEIYGDTVVWHDYRDGTQWDVYAYDISDQHEWLLCGEPTDSYMPRIHGTKVVFTDERDGATNGFDVYQYDLVSGTESPLVDAPDDQEFPAIWGQRVVWEDYATSNGRADVQMLDLITGETVKVTDESADPEFTARDYDPRIWFDVVAWSHEATPTSQWDVWMYNATSDEATAVTNLPLDQESPYIWGNMITWEGNADETTNTTDIFAYSLSSNETATVTTAPGWQYAVMHWGNKIVWTDDRNGIDDVWMAAMPLEGDRAAGPTRYQTAVEASKSHFSSAKTVVLATGADFADALAASGLCGCVQGPLLLTTPDALHPDAMDEIERLGATDVIIVGGTGAVSAAVAGDLVSEGLDVQRIGGADRYETAALIAREMEAMMGAAFPKTAFLARGDVFADALCVSPLSYYNRFPILLTRTDTLPDSTADAIADLDIETGVVTGGSGAVTEAVQDDFDDLLEDQGGAPSERWAGVNRYETADMVAGASTERNWAGRGFVGLATGENFPDALAGGVAAGQEFGVIMLTQPHVLSEPASIFIGDSGDGIGWLQAFGGTSVVSDDVLADAVDMAD